MRDWAVFIIYNSTLVDELFVWLDPFFDKSFFFSRGNLLIYATSDSAQEASVWSAYLHLAAVPFQFLIEFVVPAPHFGFVSGAR